MVLRIHAGSQEAGFLGAFCPVEEAPALVLILWVYNAYVERMWKLTGTSNGQLLDLIKEDASREDFEARIRKALASSTTTSEAVQGTTGTLPSGQQEVSPSQAAASNPTPETTPIQEERQASAKAKGKQKQTDPPPPPAPSEPTSSPARNDWLQQQRQRKLDARKERERIMAQIEADKTERRARREQEKKAREEQQAATITDETATPMSQLRGTATTTKASKATTSNLQVRLLDGGTIRKQFPSNASLENDVRPWIDANLETKAPYTFKQILAPQPARAISTSEEHASLRELDLLPSATLVLQPVQTYSDAYTPDSGGLMSMPYNAVTGAYGLVSGTLSGAANWLRGGLFRPEDDAGGQVLGQAAAQSEQNGERRPASDQSETRGASARDSMRIRTLADQRDGGVDQQFYNGNSLDFEPNADESPLR